MDVKEVERRGKALTKAAQSGEPSSSILNILGELEKGLRPTEDLLRSTRIGVTVNRLRTHKDGQVASLATKLVTNWKNEVKKKSASGTGTPGGRPGAPGGRSSATQSPAPAAVPAARKHNVAPDKRSHKTDKINYNVTGNDTRDACVRLMYDGLAFMSEEMPDEILSIAKQIESAAYSNAGDQPSDSYKSKMRSLFQNLKNKSNPGLRKRVLSGEITPKRFVVMTHDELKSAERRAEDERLEKENMNQAMVAQVEKSISDSLMCGKCKQKKVSYSQAQTRSADEPMTTFCECMNCGNRWKFS